ncbi:unnamed protein product (macronuclear) [Paramecium tetraurelia]|uniref:Uncharacterized protein n=1 Tax=Paramecium tetraurelia TaxID=5888 RepID=A0D4W5_PARTE|nr:uncharacterized protein GSPATT00013529001 [Paramecium tetraurelia]CAK78082.1 unnamed protein product [Paramecium tetraurelia]|eukprot:XP_001445479.1 hypothetical protein (macronuclear) [Paramecium tetraurelia strain d4-2]
MSCQRITVTKRGVELQEQLKDILKKNQKIHKIEHQRGVFIQQYYVDNSSDPLKRQNIGKEQFGGYLELLEQKMNSPEKIKVFLNQRFSNQPKFIQKEVEKVSQKIYNYGNSQFRSHHSLPSLDFRQVQHLKTKYSDGFWNSQNLSMTGNTFFKPKDDEVKTRKVNYLMFQEAKIERMITKYDKFNEKAQFIPSFEKGKQKNSNLATELLKAMEKKDNENKSGIHSRNQLETCLKSRFNGIQQLKKGAISSNYDRHHWDNLRVGK